MTAKHMSDISDAIAAYQQAVRELPSGDAENAEEKVLKALLARDRVAIEVTRAVTLNHGTVVDIAGADRLLKTKAREINQIVGPAKLEEWRVARQPSQTAGVSHQQGDEWWWSLAARADGESWGGRALTFLLWGCVLISLSFIIESLRRFLSSEVGVLGTVMQGIVTLLVGSSLVQLAGQLVAARSAAKAGESKKPPPLPKRLIFPATFAVIALVMWFLLPWVVRLYSDRGVERRHEGQLAHPISYYQRSISLDPTDAVAHYNLARAYDAIAEYDKAEAEYKSAIRWDETIAVAYDGLAGFMISQKKAPGGALRLLNTGLEKLEAQKSAGAFPNEDDYKRIKVSLLRNRAWAYAELKFFTQAEDDLRAAIDLKPDTAAPHCLLGQVLEDGQKAAGEAAKAEVMQEARTAYEKCVALSEGQGDKIEATWMAHAQERLSREPEKEPAPDTRQRKPRR